MTILKVKAMLAEGGGGFRRYGDDYEEVVRAVEGGVFFEHSVSGENDQGGFGGCATLSVSILPGNFDWDGWGPL